MSEAAVETGVPAKSKTSKIDEKRQEIFRDRVKRKMGEGATEEQAITYVLREDYAALPIEQKFARLESMVANAVNQLTENVNVLRQNERVVADAFDINYRAVEKMFKKLGVPSDEQNAILDECRKEVAEDRAKQMAAHEAEMKDRALNQANAQVMAEGKEVSDELNKTEKQPIGLDAPSDRPVGPDPHVADGATEFGT